MDIPGNGGRVDIDMDDFRVGSEGMELSGDPVVKAGTDGKERSHSFMAMLAA